MIISAEKVNESYLKFCSKEGLDNQHEKSVEKFFQWYCQKKGFVTFRKVDGFKFEFSSTPFSKPTKEEFEDACIVDEAIRRPTNGIIGQQFVHRSLIPLREVDFRTAEEAGQIDMFNNECEGMCGV